MKLAVCVSGRGSNLVALLQALRGSEAARVVLVLSNRADAPALERAREWGIAAESLASFKDGAEWLERLRSHEVDLIVLAGYLKLVPPDVIRAYRGRIVNIHPALLPAFGGSGMYGHHVHEAVIRSGAAQSGATVHLVDEEYDRGAILAQARVPVLPGDTPDTLAARVLEAEHRLLPQVILHAAAAGRPVPLADPLASPA
ncbi:MAG TPA: phosphoribosylglycinamide formyltransferase [Gemmatimonadales bacterium]|nr:phosphoribosylglycinamide formyltransferase [Gemmatimonadales bacterium]